MKGAFGTRLASLRRIASGAALQNRDEGRPIRPLSELGGLADNEVRTPRGEPQ